MRTTKQINIKNGTYYCYNDVIDIENFDARILKIDKKNQIRTLVFTISDISQRKKLMIVCILIVLILYI